MNYLVGDFDIYIDGKFIIIIHLVYANKYTREILLNEISTSFQVSINRIDIKVSDKPPIDWNKFDRQS